MRTLTIYNDPVTRATVTEPWVYWDDGFNAEELKKVVEYCDGFELHKGTVFSGEDLKTRNSDVKFHNRNQDNGWIFDRLNFIVQSANEMFYGFNLNGYDCFQYTTYGKEDNQHYDWHMDIALGKTKEQSPLIRKLSLSLLLNDDFEGGKFHINDGNENKPRIVPTKKGRAVLFPSFMIHRVTPVTKGIRRSLVVWVLGPKFQ
jgi:PKHD-type hydroxylase